MVADAPMRLAIKALCDTLAARAMGVDLEPLEAFDRGLDELVEVFGEITAEMGSELARGTVAPLLVSSPKKTAALLCAALARLVSGPGSGR